MVHFGLASGFELRAIPGSPVISGAWIAPRAFFARLAAADAVQEMAYCVSYVRL